jgi:hypothetical protein
MVCLTLQATKLRVSCRYVLAQRMIDLKTEQSYCDICLEIAQFLNTPLKNRYMGREKRVLLYNNHKRKIKSGFKTLLKLLSFVKFKTLRL